jgi:hypothetical protein
MKHLIVLPGNSARNKVWGERMLSHYVDYFDSRFLQEYDHWGSGADMDMVVEEQKLRAHVETLEKDTQVFVLAKSAGSILCLGAIEAHILSPVYAVFFGMPLEWAITDVFGGNWSAVESYAVPSIAFHNNQDSTATYAYTQQVIKERMRSVTLVTTKGAHHNYDDFDTYDTYILPIIQR